MKSLTINEPIPDRGVEEGLRQKVADLLSGLEVDFELNTEGEKPVLELHGRDEEAAENLVTEELRTAAEVDEGAVFTGRLVEPGKVGFGIFVDAGEEQVLMPLRLLREALGEEEGSVREIADEYGLVEELPVEVEVVESDGEPEVAPTDAEVERLKGRREEGVLIVSGATKSRLKRALNDSGGPRGVKRIESLSTSLHVVHTRAGTDPVGLIPEIGPSLGAASLEAVGPEN